MLIAKVARILVCVLATMSKRNNVVDDVRYLSAALTCAVLAQSLGTLEASYALGLSCPTAKTGSGFHGTLAGAGTLPCPGQ
jgi:hypothetical protein